MFIFSFIQNVFHLEGIFKNMQTKDSITTLANALGLFYLKLRKIYLLNCLVIKRNNYLPLLSIKINSKSIALFFIGMHD